MNKRIGESFFLGIGIDDYSKMSQFQKLDNPVFDVQLIAAVLENKYGFTTTCLLDDAATKAAIKETLYKILQQATVDDNVVIYYAGHGYRRENSRDGYWVPVDADSRAGFINNSEIFDEIRDSNARHILLVSDSCYSGTFITRTRAGSYDGALEELEMRPSRWVFTSGEETPVKDGAPGEGSPFSNTVHKFFDDNTKKIISAGQLFNAVSRELMPRIRQKPQFEVIESKQHKDGQMVFRLKEEYWPKQTTISEFTLLDIPLPDGYIIRTLSSVSSNRNAGANPSLFETTNAYLADLLKRHKRLVILGSAGAGKSAEIVHFAKTLRKDKAFLIPVYKRFNTYVDQAISSYLPEGWDKIQPTECLLILDGLDEIQPARFDEAVRKINAFSQSHPDISIIVTCRSNFYILPEGGQTGTLEGFEAFQLNDIGLNDIKTLVEKRYFFDGQAFLFAAHNAGLFGILQKPYFLRLIVSHYQRYGNFDNGKQGILESALDQYYEHDKQHFKLESLPTKTFVFSILEEIAFVMTMMGKNHLSEEELHQIFADRLPFDIWKFLTVFRIEPSFGYFTFEHNNIQEFFAARSLRKSSFESLLSAISIRLGSSNRIKPNWVNTVSFIVTDGNNKNAGMLIDWLVKHEPDLLVRFEPERVGEDRRVSIFKDIFNHFASRQSWLHSNKFTHNDLARFGAFTEILDFLLAVIDDTSSALPAKLNAVTILGCFNYVDFPHYKERVQLSLFKILDKEELSMRDIYTVLAALSSLSLNERDAIDNLLARIGKSRNQYLRAGLYAVLGTSDLLDDYVSVFLEGLQLNNKPGDANDREDFTLGDEDFYLEEGLKKLQQLASLKTVINRFIGDPILRLEVNSNHNMLQIVINKTIQLAEPEDSQLYDLMKRFYIETINDFNPEFAATLLPYFEKIHKREKLFDEILSDATMKSYEKMPLLRPLLNHHIIDNIIANTPKNFYNSQELYLIQQIMPEGQLKAFESAAKVSGNPLPALTARNWEQFHHERWQLCFDLQFRPSEFAAEVLSIFEKLQKDDITKEELTTLRRENYLLEKPTFSQASLNLVGLVMGQFDIVEKSAISMFLSNTNEFEELRIKNVYEYLNGTIRKYITVSDEQKNVIADWCNTKISNRGMVWAFVNSLGIAVLESVMLGLTLYYDFRHQPGIEKYTIIDALEKYVPVDSLRRKVAENLTLPGTHVAVWSSNASYAIRQNMTTSYPTILSRLEHVIADEYRWKAILEIWFTKTQNTTRLRSFIEIAQTPIMQRYAIELLFDSGKDREYVVKWLTERLTEAIVEDSEKEFAAGLLIKLNEEHGFDYLYAIITQQEENSVDFYKLNFSHYTQINSLHKLIHLLEISKEPRFQEDNFNNLGQRVSEALLAIGTSNEGNYLAVREAVLTLINQKKGYEYMEYNLQNMEEKLTLKNATDVGISAALKSYYQL